jgi:glycosyltransferase involved in cell wall biosynthesis
MNEHAVPEVSVVIATRNRARTLGRTLAALAAQTYHRTRFEIVVVANDCSDDTAAKVRALRAPDAMRLIEIPSPGMGRARNEGAAAARGRLLAFLDDDVEPLPDWLAAHAEAHGRRTDLVAVGPLLAPPPPRGRRSLLIERLHALDQTFAALLAGTTELDWACMTGGNVSMPRALFDQAGRFDPTIVGYGSEDYELGLRAQKVGLRAQKVGAHFAFVPGAGGYHHRPDDDSLVAYLQRGQSVGRNDARLARRHPEMIDHLTLARVDRPHTRIGRLARTLAFDRPGPGDAAARALCVAGSVLASLRWRRRWNRLVDDLHEYWYFRGVADEVGGGVAVASYLAALRRAREPV